MPHCSQLCPDLPAWQGEILKKVTKCHKSVGIKNILGYAGPPIPGRLTLRNRENNFRNNPVLHLGTTSGITQFYTSGTARGAGTAGETDRGAGTAGGTTSGTSTGITSGTSTGITSGCTQGGITSGCTQGGIHLRDINGVGYTSGTSTGVG